MRNNFSSFPTFSSSHSPIRAPPPPHPPPGAPQNFEPRMRRSTHSHPSSMPTILPPPISLPRPSVLHAFPSCKRQVLLSIIYLSGRHQGGFRLQELICQEGALRPVSAHFTCDHVGKLTPAEQRFCESEPLPRWWKRFSIWPNPKAERVEKSSSDHLLTGFSCLLAGSSRRLALVGCETSSS